MGMKSLAKGHNSVPRVRIEHATFALKSPTLFKLPPVLVSVFVDFNVVVFFVFQVRNVVLIPPASVLR